MKSGILIILIAILAVFTSCSLEGDVNYTPNIIFIHNPVKNGIDSLNSYYTDKSGVYLLDTIEVGDTVFFKIYADAYANNLTAFYLTQSADGVSKIIYPDKNAMDSIFLSTSDYNKGVFNMDGTHSLLFFPFYYVALKPSNEAKLGFAVTSDAVFEKTFGSNSNSFELKTPIKAKKITTD